MRDVLGKQFGIPWSMGIVGFWYRTDLFAQAGPVASVRVSPDSLDLPIGLTAQVD